MSAADARAYLASHQVEEKLMEAIRKVTRERPADPVKAIGELLAAGQGSSLSTLTWNIAAINNNPFEYWLTHPDAAYDKLMEDVQNFVEAPGDLDVKVGTVFTPAMFEELDALMTAQGWEAAEPAAAAYKELAERTIIAGFLKDADLGSKRLMSMPDRMTNTIDVAGGGIVYRPTVISSFDGDMSSVDTWWASWKDFHFTNKLSLPGKKGAEPTSKLPCELLTKIPRAKYPALSEEEEAMSVRLQTICLAIFDALLVHMLNTLSPGGKWIQMKRDILEALLHKKTEKTLGVLSASYPTTDVLFLQEVRTANPLKESLSASYFCSAPAKPSKADQNSVIFLLKSKFDETTVSDVTAKVMEHVPAEGAKISDGDLLVIQAADKSGQKYLLASFHGDTDGLATAPTLAAVSAYAATVPECALVFGLDANTYFKAKPGKQAASTDFLKDVYAKGLAASCGEATETRTTFCARTYLQPQLQKACKAAEKKSKGDYNPKDYILFSPSALSVTSIGCDNTGKGKHDADMVIPTLDWPSDHALLYTTFDVKPSAAALS